MDRLWRDIRDHMLCGRNKLFILLSVFVVTGCGETTYWSKFGGSPDEFDQIQAACHKQTYILQPDYKRIPPPIDKSASRIIAPYQAPFQNLSAAYGSSVSAFDDIARKEALFEKCMIDHDWKKISVSAVALTEPVFARVASETVSYRGIATGYLDRTGIFKMKNDAGNVCVAGLRYKTNWTGDGSMRCGNGDSAIIEFQGYSGFSGYGTATSGEGTQIKFVYGIEEEEIHQFLR
jgi:hypothetical protein